MCSVAQGSSADEAVSRVQFMHSGLGLNVCCHLEQVLMTSASEII